MDATPSLVRSIGADHIVDYATDDIATHTGRYDAIIDLVGNQPIRALRDALTPTGTSRRRRWTEPAVGHRNASASPPPQRCHRSADSASCRCSPSPNRDDLAAVIELAQTGTVRPIVGRTFDLSDTAEAIRQIETGHGTGRTVVTT